jgi:hypothetical protein
MEGHMCKLPRISIRSKQEAILALAAWGSTSCGCSSLSHIILVLRANHHSHRRTTFLPTLPTLVHQHVHAQTTTIP